MRKVVRTNKWHSVEVLVRRVHPDDDLDGSCLEIRLAADQQERWNGTYLTPAAALALAEVLTKAAQHVTARAKARSKGRE